MSFKLPEDPHICVSLLNTKLRDYYVSLEQLCEDLEINYEKLTSTLEKQAYHYDSKTNQLKSR